MITVNKLHKMLGKMIEQGHGRKPVCVNKQSFSHPLEGDGTVILELAGADVQWIPTSDDDGGTRYNKSGTESGRVCCVLNGGAVPDPESGGSP